MDRKKLLDEHIEKFLSELPIKDHIKDWKILFHSSLMPVKGGELHEWDLKLHTHYNTTDDVRINVIIGVKIK